MLRQAPVGPPNHADQLAELRPLVQGHDVLFLGRDNFVAYELRGARAFTAVRNYYDPNYVKPDLRLKDVFAKFDFDSVTPRALARFEFVITTRAAYASGPPPAFRPVRRTPDFVLWRRTGPVGPPSHAGRGRRPRRDPRLLEPGRTRPGGPAGGDGVLGAARDRRAMVARSHRGGRLSGVAQALTLPAGRWAISIRTTPHVRSR